jgi:hypothetical protein
MLSAFSFLLVASVALAARTRNLETYSFEQFVKDYKLSYPESEIANRRQIFNAELARVKVHNAKNAGWQETINKYSAMTPKEKNVNRGRSKGVAREIARVKGAQSLGNEKPLPSDFKMVHVSQLPKEVDWRKKGKDSYCSVMLRNVCLTVAFLRSPYHCCEGSRLLRFLLGVCCNCRH